MYTVIDGSGSLIIAGITSDAAMAMHPLINDIGPLTDYVRI